MNAKQRRKARRVADRKSAALSLLVHCGDTEEFYGARYDHPVVLNPNHSGKVASLIAQSQNEAAYVSAWGDLRQAFAGSIALQLMAEALEADGAIR